MAAYDDKVSDKRRRLFKALSAAPVVMTLRPGEALAQVSNPLQCVDKIIADPTFETGPVAQKPLYYRYESFPAYSDDGGVNNFVVVIDRQNTTKLYSTLEPGTEIPSSDYKILGNGDLMFELNGVTYKYQPLNYEVYVAELGHMEGMEFREDGYYLEVAQNGSHGMTDSCEHSFAPGTTTASLI